MGRLLDSGTGRSIVVAASHGVLTGAPRGLRQVSDMQRVFDQVSHADGLMVAPGSVGLTESAFVGKRRPSLVIHMDWKSHGRGLLPPDGERSEGVVASLVSVEAAVAAGADAVMSYLYVGQRDTALERQEVERNARLAEACDRWGMVLIIEPRAADDHRDASRIGDSDLLGWYCRLAAEIGADVVKCVWPGTEGLFADVVADTTVPVLLAGGAATDESISETMSMAHSAMAVGGAGVMFGRRIYGSSCPSAVVDGLREIVHRDGSVSDALEVFESRRRAG